ncbi:MAG: B12-binding domain-containing radical SAM protein [Nitrospirae bacterium]|nr:B12-binding domain-containing radical SAM protein [Nitrospirota bacterium]
MNITLISPYPDITVFGLRTISAYLKAHGHNCRLIFLPDPYGGDVVFRTDRYSESVLDELVTLCREADLVGVTLMTNFFDGAVQITRKLNNCLSVPVVWGGIHPTIRPEDSLRFADIVCIGESEDAMVELADKMERGVDYSGIHNLWLRSNGSIVKNPLRPLNTNLDTYPAPDYSFDDHNILFDGHLRPLTYELTRTFLERGTVWGDLKKIGYQTMTGRGCPNKCTYCINDNIRNLYGNKGYIRWRSTSHVIDELLWVKERMPFVGYIWISDESFLARSPESIEEFCREYKDKINMPFTCLASPLTITEEKMEFLLDAGLIYVQMGIESVSRRIQALFDRQIVPAEKVMNSIKIINRGSNKMYPPGYDFIQDFPYETDKDKIENLKFIADMPKPYRIHPFSLILYPETRLYLDAVKDGLIKEDEYAVYAKTYSTGDKSYLNLLMSLAKDGTMPGPLLKFLVSPPVLAALNNRAMKPAIRTICELLRLAYRKLGTLKSHLP